MQTAVKNLFGCALRKEDCFSFWILQQDRHHPPGEVERNLVQLLIFLDDRLAVEVGAIQDRPVKQVLQARLEIADRDRRTSRPAATPR